MKKFKDYLPLFILILVIIAISFAVYKSSQNNDSDEFASHDSIISPIKQKIKLPEFSLPDVLDDDKVFTQKNFINNEKKYVLINFFASWCSTCHEEHEILLRLKNENLIDIYGIAWHDFKDNTIKFLDKNGNPYKQIGLDSQGLFTKILGVKAVPETMLVDPNGIVVMRYKGNIDEEVFANIVNFINKNK